MDPNQIRNSLREFQENECITEQLFVDCSNALLEWRVKSVQLPKDFEVLLLYKLAQYGLRNDFGAVIQKITDGSDWGAAVERIEALVKGIRLRAIEEMEDHFDSEFLLRLRLIHAELHYLLDVEDLAEIPVRELMYILAVFLLIYKHENTYEIFKLCLFPVDVVKYLLSIVASAVVIKAGNRRNVVSGKHKTLFRLLKKLCKQVEDLYFAVAIHRDVVAICDEGNASVSEASLSQIIYKLDKLSTSTSSMVGGLSLFAKETSDSYRLIERSDRKMIIFRRKLHYKLRLLKALLELDLFLQIVAAYKNFLNQVRQCKTFKQLRSYSLYIRNIDNVYKNHKILYQDILNFYSEFCDLEESRKQTSYKMDVITNLENFLLTETTFELSQAVYFMESNISLYKIHNLIQLDLANLSDKSIIHSISNLWSNIDVEEQYLNSREQNDISRSDPTDLSGSSTTSNCSVPDIDLFQSNETPFDDIQLQLDETANASELSDPLSLDFPNIYHLLQQLNQLTTAATQINKNIFFDEPISEIKKILANYECSTIDGISQNYQNLPHYAWIQLRFWLIQHYNYLSQSKCLLDEMELLRAGHEMILGQQFNNFLNEDHPSYRVMTTDLNLGIVLLALLITEMSYQEVTNRKYVPLEIGELKDIRKDGVRWMQVQRKLFRSCLGDEEGCTAQLVEDDVNLNGVYFGLLDKYDKFEYHSLKDICSDAHSNCNIINIKAALKTERYAKAFEFSEKQICCLEEDFFSWESLISAFVQSGSCPSNFESNLFSSMVQKLVSHANIKSLQLLLEFQPNYDPPNALLIKSAQSGNEDLLRLLINRKKCFDEAVLKTGIAALMHQTIISQIYELCDESLKSVLTTAVKANNVDLINIILARPFTESIMSFLLPVAIHYNRFKMVENILTKYRFIGTNSLLFTAASLQHWSIFRLLIQKGADPHARVESSSPYVNGFQLAIIGKCSKMVKQFAIHTEGNRNLGYLTLAASTGSVRMVRNLLQAGFSILDEHHLYPVAWSNGQKDLNHLLIEHLQPDSWISNEANSLRTWHMILDQWKLIPYLKYLNSCEEIRRNDESFRQLKLIVLRRLKLYQTVDANWSVQRIEINQIDQTGGYDFTKSCNQLQSMLKQNYADKNMFSLNVHVYSLTTMSYAFVEIVCLREVTNFMEDIFVDKQIITHSTVLEHIFSYLNKDVVFSCSVRIFNDDSEIERFEMLHLKSFKCVAELQLRKQNNADLSEVELEITTTENRILTAIRSGDYSSTIFLLHQIGNVENEDIYLDPSLLHELLDCPNMSDRNKKLLLQKFHKYGIPFSIVPNSGSGQSAIVYALRSNHFELADLMIFLSCKDLEETQKFRTIIQQSSITLFERFLSTRHYSDEDEFYYISYALHELNVKHVTVSQDLQTYLWFKLAKYGFSNMCTNSVVASNPMDWLKSIDCIIEGVHKLRCRSDRGNVLGIDNDVLFTLRMIHKHLFFVKDKPHLKKIPVKEITFLLAIFLSFFETDGSDSNSFAIYRMVLNKITLLRFIKFVAEQLSQFRAFFQNLNSRLINFLSIKCSNLKREDLETNWKKERESDSTLPALCENTWNKLVSKKNSTLPTGTLVNRVLSSSTDIIYVPKLCKQDKRLNKKLLKLNHRVKQLYSLLKIYNTVSNISLDEVTKEVTVACMKRFSQIFGECIKNTPNSQNLPSKLNRLLNKQLSGFIRLVKQTRDVTCHDFPMARMLLPLDDQFIYYKQAGNYLQMVKSIVAVLLICTYLEYFRCLFGALRQGRSLDSIRLMIRFVGCQDAIDSLQNDCLKTITQYHMNLGKDLKGIPTRSAEEREVLDRILVNHNRRLQVLKRLEGITQSFIYKFRDIQIATFAMTSIEAVHSLLDVNLLPTNNHSILEFVENSWIILSEDVTTLSGAENLMETSATTLTRLQVNFDINQDTIQMHHCREEVRRIVGDFIEGTDFEATKKLQLESDLLSRLSKRYFNNIFMINAKTQAIKDIFGKLPTRDFHQKLNTLIEHDVEDLQNILNSKQESVLRTLKKYGCSTIETLIQNVSKIPQEAALAIEYWLLELCEIFINTQIFQDNFYALRCDLQMICGRNFRNYLAHDGLSYDLLTHSTRTKVLINALVVAQKSWKLFQNPRPFNPKREIDMTIFESGWLNDQALLLQSVLKFDFVNARRAIENGAMASGKFWTSKGIFEGPTLVEASEMIQFSKAEEMHTLGADIRKTMMLIDPFVQARWHTYSTPAWILEMALHRGDFDRAASNLDGDSWGQWAKSSRFPQCVYPCLGALLFYLETHDQNEEMLDTLMYFGPEYFRAWMCSSSRNFSDYLLKQMPSAWSEKLFHAVTLKSSVEHILEIISTNLIDPSHLNIAVLANYFKCFDHFLKNCSSNKQLDNVLESCARFGRIQMLQLLLQFRDFPQIVLDSALNLASQHQHWNVVKHLHRHSANPWIKLKLNELSAGEIAIKMGNLKLLKLFLKDQPNANGNHLLPLVAKYGSVRMVKHLRSIGCDLWKARNILQCSLANEKDWNMTRFIESSLLDFEATRKFTENKLQRWLQIIHEQKVLNFFADSPISSEGGLIALFQADYQLAKRVLIRCSTFFRINEQHCIRNICFYENRIKSNGVISQIELQINSVSSTAVHFEQNVGFKYNCGSTYQALSIDICLIDAKLNLPANLSTPNNYGSSPSALQLITDLIESIDSFTESFALIGNFEFDSRAFLFIRVDKYLALAEIEKNSAPIFINRFLNSTNTKGETFLHHLPQNVDEEFLDLILSNGVDLTAVDKLGQTALVHILRKEHSWDTLHRLLEYCIKREIRNDQGIHIFEIQDQEGRTLLKHATSYGHLRVVQFLLDHGVDQTVRDCSGSFALYEAVLLRYTAIVFALVQQRSDVVNLRHGSTGETVLFAAASLNNGELVRLFLDNGADLCSRNKDGHTVIAKTIVNGSGEALKIILEQANQLGVDVVNNITPERWNALQCALMKDNVDVFRTVLEHMVGSVVDSNMSDESLVRLKYILLEKHKTIVELDAFEAANFHHHIGICSYLQECERLFNIRMKEPLRNKESRWLSEFFEQNNVI